MICSRYRHLTLIDYTNAMNEPTNIRVHLLPKIENIANATRKLHIASLYSPICLAQKVFSLFGFYSQ